MDSVRRYVHVKDCVMDGAQVYVYIYMYINRYHTISNIGCAVFINLNARVCAYMYVYTYLRLLEKT